MYAIFSYIFPSHVIPSSFAPPKIDISYLIASVFQLFSYRGHPFHPASGRSYVFPSRSEFMKHTFSFSLQSHTSSRGITETQLGDMKMLYHMSKSLAFVVPCNVNADLHTTTLFLSLSFYVFFAQFLSFTYCHYTSYLLQTPC